MIPYAAYHAHSHLLSDPCCVPSAQIIKDGLKQVAVRRLTVLCAQLRCQRLKILCTQGGRQSAPCGAGRSYCLQHAFQRAMLRPCKHCMGCQKQQ